MDHWSPRRRVSRCLLLSATRLNERRALCPPLGCARLSGALRTAGINPAARFGTGAVSFIGRKVCLACSFSDFSRHRRKSGPTADETGSPNRYHSPIPSIRSQEILQAPAAIILGACLELACSKQRGSRFFL